MIVLGELKEASFEVVQTLPDNPNLGRVVVKGETTWAFNGTRWYVPGDPVGTIKSHYDFDISDVKAFDTDVWQYCDGSAITDTALSTGDAAGLLNGSATPDLSAGYLTGFGSPGGGNIDSAAWATGVVGNGNNTLNLSHSHTVNSHSHTVNNHHHYTGGYTDHLQAINNGRDFDVNGPSGTGTQALYLSNLSWHKGNHNHRVNTNTDDRAPGTTPSSPGTTPQLNSPQDIKPRSIRVRFIIKKR